MTASSSEPSSASNARRHDDLPVVPVGLQSLVVSPSFLAAYHEAENPVVVAERVWFGRVGDRLVVHVGRRVVVDVREP